MATSLLGLVERLCLRIVDGGASGPPVDGGTEPIVAGLPHDYLPGLSALPGHRGHAAQGAEPVVVSASKRSPTLCEHHGGHDHSLSWPGSDDRDVMVPAYL